MTFISKIPMFELGGGVKDIDGYRELHEHCINQASQVFEKDGYHSHLIAIVTPTHSFMFPFDAITKDVAEKTKIKNHGVLKDHAFAMLAQIALQMEAVGYIDVSEAWAMAMPVEPDREPLKEVTERSRKLYEEYGSIEHTPGRMEVLTVAGVFADRSIAHTWKIGRDKKKVWLTDGHKSESKLELDVDQRSDDLNKAVYENAKKLGILTEKGD